ncbi:hypothetical protein HII36_42760 [Nonomuraea sp. NN258]|uniref:hypothetical protein n=1 Tax=Nonomuraea antri TaxID=2730852 RepID=UPI0015684B5B|nr:hypothetical protein [Nonomuraea antri]NRQ38504.1 hypothetical protein [Nonomuraea antri]
MRRWIPLAAAAALVASTPAAAVPALARPVLVQAGGPVVAQSGGSVLVQSGGSDPVRAVGRQLRHERGVRVSETTRFYYGGQSTVSGSGTRISGKLQLAPSGPVAADFTWRDLRRPPSYRVIRVGKDVYDDSDQHPGPVPEGKKWIKFPNHHRGLANRDMAQDVSLQPIDVYDPAMLRAVLKRSTATAVPGGRLYRGAMSYRDLRKLTKGPLVAWTSGRPITAKSKGTVSWRLWTGRDGLLTRLYTADTAGGGTDPLVKRSDTRYRDWGFRLVITAPPADEVIDEKTLLEYIRAENEPIPEDEGNT